MGDGTGTGHDISLYWSQVDNVALHSWGHGKLREQAICVGPQPCLVSSEPDVFQNMSFTLLASLETEAQRNRLAGYKVSHLVSGRVRVLSGRLAQGCAIRQASPGLCSASSDQLVLYLVHALYLPVLSHLIILCLFPCFCPPIPHLALGKRCYGIMSRPEGRSKCRVGTSAQTTISLSLLPPAGRTESGKVEWQSSAMRQLYHDM